MAHNALLIELTTLGEEIATCLSNDKRRNKQSRHADYKTKKIREATELWDKFNQKHKKILEVVEQNEPCVNDLYQKYQRIYKEYTDRLLAIESSTKNEDFEDDFEDDHSDADFLLRMQSKRLVNLLHVMEEVLNKLDNDEAPSASYSEVKKQKINKLWNRIECDDERIFENVNGYDNYQRELNQVESLVEKSLIFLQEHSSSRSSVDSNEELKLERLKIEKFGGDYFKWITFKDLFVSFVVNSKKMGKAEKMQRLKTYITGEVSDMISDLTISEVNFDCAWDRLLNRFDNERIIIGTMINKLLNQQNCKGDAKSLKKLLDVTDQMILALTNLNRPTEHWDDWIVVIIGQKLDEETQKDWERKIGKSTTVPKWAELKDFLTEQWRLMERLETTTKKQGQTLHPKSIKTFQTSMESTCVVCQESHTLYNCPKWKSMDPKERLGVVKRNKWCKKCLKIHDDKTSCDKICKKCKKGHSTWLHENRSEQKQLTVAHGAFAENPYQILLATAVVKTYDANGTARFLRVLIDSGSEGSLITQAAASLLSKRTMKSDRWIQGLDGNKSVPLRKLHLTIQPRFESLFTLQLDFYILNTLTKMLPGHNLDPSSWKHIKLLTWADPKFFEKGKIDALLGMDAIVDIMNSGVIKGKKGQPMAQDTKLGWVMSGKIDPTYPTNEFKCFVSTNELNLDLQQFWEMEELYPERALTNDEVECEKLYEAKIRKNPNGKFIVNIPFKQNQLGPERLGESKGQAIARFLQVEKKLARDKFLNAEYKKSIQSYIDMGHMKEVTGRPAEEKVYYIPHHAVVKPDHLTTKVRVVFDASAKTTTGWSLNDCMHVGARQQRDLHDILTNWRLYKIVYKADIEKMYRMIELAEEDHKYHTILWRNSPTETIREYQLTATTFGTAAAPFLATRTLVQIAKERQLTHPLAAEALTKNFYVDDLLGGNHSINEASKCRDELLHVLGEHHLPLRKWTSNCKQFLEALPDELTEESLKQTKIKQTIIEDDTSKALGLLWSPTTDSFSYKINWLNSTQHTWTKRQFLSETSKLFDPLGWLAPITINAKLLMQEVLVLTESGLGWDDPIPETVAVKWMQFRNEFKKLESINIKRWINFEEQSTISLHGFSDASEKAYSAVIYARVETNKQVNTTLITAKTRVAPIKSKLTLPQLELCGALLVADLMRTIVKSLNLENSPVFLWTDSMITLGWIRSEPNRWKTFVANRVAKIQALTKYKWDYVPTSDNPADCASRGIMPLELIDHPLWWTGPDWLAKSAEHWPTADIQDHDLEQKRSFSVNVAQIQQSDIPETTSSWFKLRRIAAYCKRFKTKQKGSLTVDEIRMAEKGLIKQCQQENFYQEIRDLLSKNPISNKSKLKSLNVFLDQDGLLRVGGRLENANIPYSMKHPFVLPAGSHLTKIIIHQMHLDTHHGGPKLVKNLLKKKFWIIQCNRMVRTECSQCVPCRKLKGEQYKQQMGDLPEARVTLNRPFGFSGVDYAGPVEIKSSNLRSAKIQKGYVALFICMGTKAVHLEMVSDQTTKAFVAAFERFTARRGLPNEMYSDNGSNFEGADNQLQRLFFLEQNKEIAKVIVNNEVKWNFIPPGAPNFGGLWERSIRSMKDHIKRTLKTTRLTFEEYSTLLCQVEACMNSRPLCSVSDDIDNLEVLTPGHFLIGHELLAPPQPEVGLKVTDHRDRWKQVQWLQHQLWTKWNNEYLVELQQRHKWQEAAENAKAGDIVAVKDEDLAPRNWLVGKIEEVHKGNDNKVRVATIRVPEKRTSNDIGKNGSKKERNTPMKSKLIQRPIRKLCPLLVDENKQEIINHHVQKHHPKKTYNLRPRTAQLVTMALIFFGLLFGTAAATGNECIQTNKFTNNAGIYFEDIGRARVTKSEWKILIYFDLDKYNEDLDMVKTAIDKLKTLCSAAQQEYSETGLQCSQTTNLLEQQLDEVLQMNTIIQQNKQATESNRVRRAAPFNFVGWIGKKLFGFMDAESAEEFDIKIEKLKSGQVKQDTLIAEQLSIIELTKNLFKESQVEARHRFATLTQAIMKLSNETDFYRKLDQITGWTLHLSIILNKIEKNQRNIINMLTDLQQGHVSSYLFTPYQFKRELDKINDIIPNGLQLPVNPHQDMKAFYEIMRGRMRVTKDKILLEIVLPLVSVDEFQVFHIIPVPVQHNNEQICIIPESQYLVITLKRHIFYQLNEDDINKCIKTHDTPLICPAMQSARSVTSSRGKCERTLLDGSQRIDHCKIHVIPDEDVWIPLKTKNWIFGLRNKTLVNIVKGSNVDTVTLQGTGIIAIQPGCEISYHGSTIIGQSTILTTAVHNIIPTMNLSKLMNENYSKANVINLTLSNMEQFHQINHQVLKNNEKIHMVHYVHWVTHITIITLIFVLAIIITIARYKQQIQQWWPNRLIRDTSHISQYNGGTSLPIKADSKLPIKVEQSISDDSTKVNTFQQEDTRHGPGGCPFRT